MRNNIYDRDLNKKNKTKKYVTREEEKRKKDFQRLMFTTMHKRTGNGIDIEYTSRARMIEKKVFRVRVTSADSESTVLRRR